MRRLLGIFALTAMIYGCFAMARKDAAVTVSAASGPGNLELVSVTGQQAGCPAGPAYTFCDQIPGTGVPPGTTSRPTKFTFEAVNAVTGVSVALAAIPGLSANYAPGDFSIALGLCGGSLVAAQQCEVDIVFHPTASGLREGSLTLSDPAGDTLTLILAGRGTNLVVTPPPPPSCTPAVAQANAFTYCNESVGAASGNQTFTLTSVNAVTGFNVALAAVSGLSSEFNSADFTIASTTCTGTLAADVSCTINVAFTPTAAGLREAALTATDSQGDTETAYLAGHTTMALLISSNASASCSFGSFEFCNEPVGGMTGAIGYTLTNTSGTQLSGVSVPATSTGGDFKVLNTSCTASLPANGSCRINVAFSPNSTGLLEEPLTVTDVTGDLAVANFAGTGDDYSVQLASGQTNEITVVQGGTATYKAVVTADSVFGANGEQVTFVCPSNLPEFTTCSFNPCPLTIVPGTSTPFSIVIVTSSATVSAPTVNPCGGQTAGAPPTLQGPRFVFHAPATALARDVNLLSQRFPSLTANLPPALAIFVFVCVMGSMMRGGTTFSRFAGSNSRPRFAVRMPLIFATAGFAALLFLGCGGSGGTKATTATAVGVTNLTILANATDANGNSLQASRSLQFTLDVVAQASK